MNPCRPVDSIVVVVLLLLLLVVLFLRRMFRSFFILEVSVLRDPEVSPTKIKDNYQPFVNGWQAYIKHMCKRLGVYIMNTAWTFAPLCGETCKIRSCLVIDCPTILRPLPNACRPQSRRQWLVA